MSASPPLYKYLEFLHLFRRKFLKKFLEFIILRIISKGSLPAYILDWIRIRASHSYSPCIKFNSGTVQNEAVRLKGKTVKIKKYGWRIPLFSEYENVVKIEEVK